MDRVEFSLFHPPSRREYRFATPDSEANILFDEKESEARGFRVVKAGTLEKLVELLTHPQHTDTEYLRHFLTTYRSFCDSERLLELLLERYDVPDAEAVRHDAKQARFFHKQYRSPVRLRVINVLKQWVEKHFYDFQAPQARPSDPVVVSRQEMRRRWYVSARTGHNRHGSAGTSPWHRAHGRHSRSFRHLLNFHPQEVARQMTIIEFHLYKRIWPSELVGLMWTRRDKWQHAPNVLNMTVRSTLVTRWLTRCIVETANLNERVDLISMIVEILKELRSLNNFNGMMEVVSALNSAAVRRLNHAWAEVNPRRRALFDECVEQLMGGTNYSRLRQAIEHAPAPKIPFFGMYLTDMTFIEEGSSDTIPSPLGGVPLINFSKRRLLARTTGTIQQYQNQQYVLAEWPLLQVGVVSPAVCFLLWLSPGPWRTCFPSRRLPP
ncbi:uncharacterized protein MONBRDRAFT_14402 [Monosiga brevicollis MX1]|uniref:Uncharacterized protein n=1 Tax=Monosiga brevicollis TaxID=81824 RepID=A9URL6_MONBE|nr:uncharacterized protein MONBRDRAFT_14402 [Monosiga brevicollis MX1]EDQ91945.1 predicted protein [Monosiga brevicollis MX1]|eukprot:XP_001743231.1 hypothetical protein [Monosiga brevicollis MX1]